MANVKSPVRVLLVALALGWAADFLFYGRVAGISVPIFVGLLVAALFGLARYEGVHISRNTLLLGPLAFFAIMVFVRANSTLTFLNVVSAFVLLCLLYYFFAADRLERLGILGYPLVVALSSVHALTGARPAVRAVASDSAHYKHQVKLAVPLLRGVVLALPLLVVFTYLLSAADSVFSGYVGRLFQQDFLSGVPERLWRQVLVLGAAWVIAGALLYALTRHHGPDEGEKRVNPFKVGLFDRTIGYIEGSTVLVLVNMLFMFFAWVQFTNIFFGQPASMPYEEYRNYVRHGFGELLVVAALTLALVISLRHFVWKETLNHVTIFNLLCTLMIALGMVMLVSAFMRSVVWESVQFYISTPLRLYVRAFIIWLGVAFMWLLFTTWLKPQRFAIGAFGAALGFLITINILNPDADVAAYNLARNDELSTRYLYLLSEDAVPAMVRGLDQTSGDVHEALRQHLAARLARMESDPPFQEWPSYHLARSEAYNKLNELRASGRLDPPMLETEYAQNRHAPGLVAR